MPAVAGRPSAVSMDVIGTLGGLFNLPFQQPTAYTLSGVTKDARGVALAGVTVKGFETATDLKVGTVVSASDGTWSLVVDSGSGKTFYAVEYLAGSPDRAGASVNTLVGA